MFKKLSLVLLLIFVLALAGCSKPGEQTAGRGAAASPEGGAAGNAPGATAARGGGAAATATAPAAKPVEPPKPIVIAAETPISIRLIDSVSSAANHSGDSFLASLDDDVVADGKVIFPRNTRVRGTVTRAVPSGRLKTPAELAITLTEIEPEHGGAVGIETNTIAEKAKSHKTRNAEMIGGGAGVGALIGAIAGKGKGAAIGGAVGAGAGTATAYGTGKKDIGYASEARLTFHLRREVTIQR